MHSSKSNPKILNCFTGNNSCFYLFICVDSVGNNEFWGGGPPLFVFFSREQFDIALQGKTLEALNKIFQKGFPPTEENVRKEIELSERGTVSSPSEYCPLSLFYVVETKQ
jgi:hypothetical protein